MLQMYMIFMNGYDCTEKNITYRYLIITNRQGMPKPLANTILHA